MGAPAGAAPAAGMPAAEHTGAARTLAKVAVVLPAQLYYLAEPTALAFPALLGLVTFLSGRGSGGRSSGWPGRSPKSVLQIILSLVVAAMFWVSGDALRRRCGHPPAAWRRGGRSRAGRRGGCGSWCGLHLVQLGVAGQHLRRFGQQVPQIGHDPLADPIVGP